MGMNGRIKIFSASANEVLAKEITGILKIPMGNCDVSSFSDGEISISIKETVRGCDCFIIQPTCAPVNVHLMQLLVMIDAMRRASACRITAVIPYYGYARQDRKNKARDPITAKLVSNLIAAAGTDRVLTMDLHAPQIQGFFDIPLDHLLGGPIISAHYKSRNFIDKNLVIVSPDLGSVARVRAFAASIDAPLAIIDKRRPKVNLSEVMNIVGDVKGKRCLLIDDMIDTAGTLTAGAQALMDRGATDVSACCTHAVLSGPAIERIQNSCLKEVVVTNTIPLSENKRIDKIRVLSVAAMFAEAIERIYEDLPVSSLFIKAPTDVKPIGVQERLKII